MLRSLPVPLPHDAVLIVIDLQRAIDHPGWGQRNNPDAEKNVATLLQVWRTSQRPIYHIRHDSTEPASHYRPGQPGNEFKPEVAPLPEETFISKRTNSAFIGTDLEAQLRAARQSLVIVTGVITNNSVEATVRMAGNLGFETFLVEDGCFTFAQEDWNGTFRTASEVHAMSLANLDGEYCRVILTADVLAAAGQWDLTIYDIKLSVKRGIEDVKAGRFEDYDAKGLRRLARELIAGSVRKQSSRAKTR